MAEVTPTRGAALALAEERNFLETGFGFLDEKRMLLAATLMQELAAWTAQRTDYDRAWETAVQALRGAVRRHGLEGIQLYPETSGEPGPVTLATTRLLGLELSAEPAIDWPEGGQAARGDLRQVLSQTPGKSAEAEACRTAFGQVVAQAAKLAARQANVHRLIAEYRATERRARALENVLLPETTSQLRAINDYLDEADQEEAIRLRNAAALS